MKYPIAQDLSRTQVKQIIRQKRQSLTRHEQNSAGLELSEQIKHLSIIDNAKNIAIYLSSDGEVDTQPIIEWLWKQKNEFCCLYFIPFPKGIFFFLNIAPLALFVIINIVLSNLNSIKLKSVL